MPFISFIKLNGPPIYDAIKALSKIALDLPQVCIMESGMNLVDWDSLYDPDYIHTHLSSQLSPIEIDYERCSNIVSKSGIKLGEYDFYYEWFTKPTQEQIYALIQKIDEALKPIGCRYSITSENK